MLHRNLAKLLLRCLNLVVVVAIMLQSTLPASRPIYAQSISGEGDAQVYRPPISKSLDGIERITPSLTIPTVPVNNPVTAELSVEPLVSTSAANGPGLSITHSGSNIQLTWTAVAGSQSYEVHRSTAPFFTPSPATLVQTLPTNATTYTDSGAAGDPNVNHFYIVRTVNSDEQSDSNTVGEIDYALNNAGGKYSLVALPFPSATIINAATLASHIGNVGALLKWNPTTQTFRFFSPPASGDNFPVTVGDAIFVLVNSGGPSVVTMTGTVTPVQHILRPGGFNFVSVPLQQTNLIAANIVAADVTGTQALLAWNETTQLFRFFSPPASGDNFAVKPGTPFIMQLGSTMATAWPIALPPVVNAPAVDTTVATNIYSATAFLYTGSNPVQTGVQPDTIEAKRAAVLRGLVFDRAGNPLPGVTVTVLNHPEYGQTLSRDDGMFDLVVNGGDRVTVNYGKLGYLPAQRQVEAPWQDYGWLEAVNLLPLDSQVTTVNLATATELQVARGNPVTDSDGTRQSTLLFSPGTQAEMVLPGGGVQPLSTLQVRATEYTVGEQGPAAMPGELPPNSGYTYAVELSIDQALAANATEVRFNQPVIHYVENFLNFPVGIPVPLGYYAKDKGIWVPTDSGRIIKLLSVNNGLAELDLDGSGVAADAAALAALGITDAERQRLATLYQPGQSLWRIPINHFTGYDANWNITPPGDAEPHQAGAPQDGKGPDDPDNKCGSILEVQTQCLGEAVEIVGTPHSVNYRSYRIPGRLASRTLQIPLSGQTLPVSLKRIDLEIAVAGRIHKASFPRENNLRYTFVWDGRDAYERLLQGEQPVTVRIGYAYDGVYQGTDRFGYNGNGIVITGDRSRGELILWQTYQTSVSYWDYRAVGVGGWSLNAHHVYDPVGKVLHLGNGERRAAENVNPVINTVAGGGTSDAEGLPALATRLGNINDVVVAPDGSFYISIYSSAIGKVRRVDKNGIVTTVAGGGSPAGELGDGGPATQARLNGPLGIALDANGALYIADYLNHRIRRVGPNGIITTVAGTGVAGDDGDGGLAINAQLNFPRAVAVDAEGNLYIADVDNHRVRRVAPDGIITTVAGTGTGGYNGEGILATQAQLQYPLDLAVGLDGSLYIADGQYSAAGMRVRRVGTNGIMRTVAGNACTSCDFSSGGRAIDTALPGLTALAVATDGSLYLGLGGYKPRIVHVTPEGIASAIAGDGHQGNFGVGDTGPSASARFSGSGMGLDVAPDGAIYVADGIFYDGQSQYNVERIRRISPPLPGFSANNLVVASADGAELYEFTAAGRHLRTVNALTGAELYHFTYSTAGLLATIVDGDSNITTIERDANGNPTAIIGPYGQRTTLTVNVNGYLAGVMNPAGENIQFSYGNGGLLTTLTKPKGEVYQFTYDSGGRLLRDDDPAGGFQTLLRTELATRYQVTHTTAANYVSGYQVEPLTTGEQRRFNTLPDGTHSELRIGTDDSRTVTQPDGTVTTLAPGPDPRWGMQSSLPKQVTTQTPGGLVTTITSARLINLVDPGNLLSLTEQTDEVRINGRLYTSVYTAANRRFTNTTPLGRQTSTVIDAQGRVLQEEWAGLAAVNYVYDARGRLVSLSQGSGADMRTLSLIYNPGGDVSTITDSLNRTVQFVYDGAGRVTQQTLPDGRVIGYGYDANGNPTSLTPPGRPAHTFTYTSIGLLATYTAPDLGTGANQTTRTYNTDRQLTQIAFPGGQTLDFGYDNAGRLQTLTSPRGAVVYSYDPTTGQPSTIAAPGGINLGYSHDGSMLTSESWSGPVTASVARTYDNNYRVTALSINGGDAVSFQYDNDGLLTQAGTLALTRHPQNGLLTGSTLGNVSDAWSYNSFGEPTQYRATYNSSELYNAAYTYDKLGRITAKSETISGVTTHYKYGYDLAGRLSTVQQNGVASASYTYDSNGNRLSYTGPAGPVNGTYDAQDRLLQYGATTFTYTANGELHTKTVGGQTTTYQYDPLGNLTRVDLPDGTLIEYLIDGNNRRIGKKVDGVLVQGFLYQNSLKPIAELDGAGNLVSHFVYASRGNVPDYMVRGGVTYRIVADHLGSPQVVLDVATGVEVQRMDYDEFGNVALDTNPGFQPFGFAGGIYDQTTTLTRFGFRDYDAQPGRWTTKDPVLFNGGSTNLYAYVQNDPLNLSDPLGLEPNGCGPSILPWTINKPFGYNFTDACNQHDTAYDTLGKPKDQADMELLKDLLKVCDEAKQSCEDTNASLGCKTLAYFYSIMVHEFGDLSYIQGQFSGLLQNRGAQKFRLNTLPSGGVRG